MKKVLIGLGILLAIAVIFAMALPSILKSRGLHPDYDGPSYELPGKRALIITTSHGVLNKPGETEGKATGVFGSELSVPYYDFQDAGMSVDVASIKGGAIPIDPMSYKFMIVSDADKRSRKDVEFQDKVTNSLKIDNVDFTQYDAIFLAGGWGAMIWGNLIYWPRKSAKPIMIATLSLAGSVTARSDLSEPKTKMAIS